MPTRNINLTEHFDHFVQAQVSSGLLQQRQRNHLAALRLLEEQEQEYGGEAAGT